MWVKMMLAIVRGRTDYPCAMWVEKACLPVHTFNLTALKIAIIMDIFTEVKIHGHDKPQLSFIFGVFKT